MGLVVLLVSDGLIGTYDINCGTADSVDLAWALCISGQWQAEYSRVNLSRTTMFSYMCFSFINLAQAFFRAVAWSKREGGDSQDTLRSRFKINTSLLLHSIDHTKSQSHCVLKGGT